MCVLGQMVVQSKDLCPFIGLQNKGCKHSDIQQKRNAYTSKESAPWSVSK
jgi:hypothetical protein